MRGGAATKKITFEGKGIIDFTLVLMIMKF